MWLMAMFAAIALAILGISLYKRANGAIPRAIALALLFVAEGPHQHVLEGSRGAGQQHQHHQHVEMNDNV